MGDVISSVRNARIAAALRLQRRAFRDEDRRFLVEGAQAVGEALGAGALRTLYVTSADNPLVLRASASGIEVILVSEHVMERLTATVTPPGLLGIADFLDVDLDAVSGGSGCVAVLHAVRDPGNAGTVLRSADAAGADAVVFTDGSVDPYNPKAVRASAGSLFHLPVVRSAATADAVAALRGRGHAVLAMDARGPVTLDDVDLDRPVAFLFGNEAWGLPPEVRDLADQVVRVPISERAESLNLAAAATVCLFEWARRGRARARG